jgi:hypothetical protein
MIVMIATVDPGVLVPIAMVIAIVVTLVVTTRPRDDASGTYRGNGEHQTGDSNSCCVFHGVSW